MRIAVVEDVDSKFNAIEAVLRSVSAPDISISRAENLNDAEDLVMIEGWDVAILDLSMNIAAGQTADLGSGHATLAGLDVVERISLLQLNVPVIIVTGFDTFQDPDRFDNEIMTTADVEQICTELIGDLFIALVRYAHDGWEAGLLEGVVKRVGR